MVGLPAAVGDALVCDLLRYMTQPALTYLHEWEKSDTVCWDNRRTAHAAAHYDPSSGPRVMWRTTVGTAAGGAVAAL